MNDLTSLKAGATTVRWGLTLLVLSVVWRHVHWSVALMLTLLSIANEIQVFAKGQGI